MLCPEYLAEELTPYPLPTKDGGVLRTIGDARAYMMVLPKKREHRAHWQHACRLLLQQVGAAALTRQVQVALFMDGKLDAGAFEHMSSARRWRNGRACRSNDDPCAADAGDLQRALRHKSSGNSASASRRGFVGPLQWLW